MSGSYRQIYLAGSRELRKTAVYLWKPPGEVRGVVQIIHGMREHMGRYREFAEALLGAGYAVCGQDHMGHGKNWSDDAAFGFFGESNGALRLVRDCRRVTRFLQREFPQTPLFLLGHSMGSYIGRIYILHFAKELAGFLCLGTGGEQRLAPYARALAQLMIKTQGPKEDALLLHRITFADYNRRFSGEPSPSAWLSRDLRVSDAYDADPLILPYFTNAGMRDLYDLQIASTAPGWYDRVDPTLPILILGGEEDPVGDYGKGPLETYTRLQEAGVEDVSLILYKGARHELLNELNRDKVTADILSWMEPRRGPAQA